VEDVVEEDVVEEDVVEEDVVEEDVVVVEEDVAEEDVEEEDVEVEVNIQGNKLQRFLNIIRYKLFKKIFNLNLHYNF